MNSIKVFLRKGPAYVLPFLVLWVFSTTFYAFMRNEVDYFQVAVMMMATVYFYCHWHYSKDDMNFYLLLVFMLFSCYATGVFSITSYLYSLCFVSSFLFFKHTIKRGLISLDDIIKFCSFLIFAYFFVIVIQQLSKALGLPILNGLEFYTSNNRYNALSNEPSHTSRILLVLMVSYMYAVQIRDGINYNINSIWGKDKRLWFAYTYTLTTSGSATAFLVIPVTLLFFADFKTVVKYGLVVFIMGICAIKYIEIPAFLRIKELLEVIFSLDTEMISYVDSSAAARINPPFYYFEDFRLNSAKTWFGYGAGYAEPMLIERVLGHRTDFESGAGGVFPNFFYNYGLVCGVLFIYCLIKTCFSRRTILYVLIWCAFFYATDLNTYMQWLFFCLAFSVKYFYHTQVGSNEKIDYRRP